MKKILILFLIIQISISVINSQENTNNLLTLENSNPTITQIIKVKDGSIFIGKIIAVEDTEIRLKTKYGTLTILKTDISQINSTSGDRIEIEQEWFDNPNTTRLFFAPTGRMLKKGEGYFADYFVLFPTVSYGLTDNLTMGGGFSIVPGLDPDEQVLLFTPKLRLISNKKMNLAIGALMAKLPEDAPSAGILYAVNTYGSEDRSLTTGIGFGYIDDALADKPIVVIGGETRTSKSIALVTENWLVPEKDTPVLSAGLRFFGEKLSTDFALIFPLETEVIAVPYIDFVYKF